jgi:hypothetical protein
MSNTYKWNFYIYFILLLNVYIFFNLNIEYFKQLYSFLHKWNKFRQILCRLT